MEYESTELLSHFQGAWLESWQLKSLVVKENFLSVVDLAQDLHGEALKYIAIASSLPQEVCKLY
jgi:hypothetical protein